MDYKIKLKTVLAPELKAGAEIVNYCFGNGSGYGYSSSSGFGTGPTLWILLRLYTGPQNIVGYTTGSGCQTIDTIDPPKLDHNKILKY